MSRNVAVNKPIFIKIFLSLSIYVFAPGFAGIILQISGQADHQGLIARRAARIFQLKEITTYCYCWAALGDIQKMWLKGLCPKQLDLIILL